MIDRNLHIQAALLFWLPEDMAPELIGASPVSTGKKNGFPKWGKYTSSSTQPPLYTWSPGSAQSKGCIRIPATLNKLLDHYGLLDADYERSINKKNISNLLDTKREPTAWSGRHMLVVDSRRVLRPEWSPLPIQQQRSVTK